MLRPRYLTREKIEAKAAEESVAADNVEYVWDVEQGSDEWFDLRRGIPTASGFSKMLAEGNGDTRSSYMRVLAGEQITGLLAEGFQSTAMIRGKSMEESICDGFERTSLSLIKKVGFVRRTVVTPLGGSFVVGCSPDRVIDEDGILEVKSMRPDLLIDLREKGARGFPTGYRAQCQGNLWVTGRRYVHLRIGYTNMPSADFVVERDESYIARLKSEAERFVYELRKMVERHSNG